jgi:hypothetical protein
MKNTDWSSFKQRITSNRLIVVKFKYDHVTRGMRWTHQLPSNLSSASVYFLSFLGLSLANCPRFWSFQRIPGSVGKMRNPQKDPVRLTAER